MVGHVEKQVGEIDGLEDDTLGRIEFSDALNEERTEASEKVARDDNSRTLQRVSFPGQGRQPFGELRQLGLEFVQGSDLGREPLPLA